MNFWIVAICIYFLLAIGSFIPTLLAIIRGVKPHDGGDSFDKSPNFSDDAKARLNQHFSRISGTLGFWKKQAEIYRLLYYYRLIWTIPASVLISFLAHAIINDSAPKWLVTIISAHTAILLAFHKALKVDVNFRTLRKVESQFYDLHRRILDLPDTFGETESNQLSPYFEAVEHLRTFIRNVEIDNTPSFQEAKKQYDRESK